MNIFIIILTGYLLGGVNPAAMLAKFKQVDLRARGTKNLGASNAMLVMGKKCGALVMVIDIFKAFFAVKIAKWMFPRVFCAGLLAGLAAVAGHVFPFHLNFRGGKGLAAFGGLVLAFDPAAFVFLLALGLALMVVVNYSYVMPMSAATLFPVMELLRTGSVTVFFLCACASGIVIVKHWGNIARAKRGEDIQIRSFIKEKLLGRDG